MLTALSDSAVSKVIEWNDNVNKKSSYRETNQ